jgi:hypothetical protein
MKTRLAVAALAAALAPTAVVAATGSAQAPAGTTLHLAAKSQKNVGFFPSGRPHQGEHLGFGDTITGDDNGYDRAACTIVGRSPLCTIQVQLSKGTLSVQGIAPQRSDNTPFAVIGGTGAYDGASGTAFVTDTSSTTTSITVVLRAA